MSSWPEARFPGSSSFVLTLAYGPALFGAHYSIITLGRNKPERNGAQPTGLTEHNPKKAQDAHTNIN